MLARLVRILAGFLLACLGAGLTLVLFVLTPAEMAGLPPDVLRDRLAKALDLAAVVAIQFALFSAPFVLVAATLGELLRNRSWIYYVVVGLVVTGLGFYAQQATEQVGQATIANRYALTAFITAGFVAGLLFWAVSGRFAGGPEPKPAPPPDTTSGTSHGVARKSPAEPSPDAKSAAT